MPAKAFSCFRSHLLNDPHWWSNVHQFEATSEFVPPAPTAFFPTVLARSTSLADLDMIKTTIDADVDEGMDSCLAEIKDALHELIDLRMSSAILEKETRIAQEHGNGLKEELASCLSTVSAQKSQGRWVGSRSEFEEEGARMCSLIACRSRQPTRLESLRSRTTRLSPRAVTVNIRALSEIPSANTLRKSRWFPWISATCVQNPGEERRHQQHELERFFGPAELRLRRSRPIGRGGCSAGRDFYEHQKSRRGQLPAGLQSERRAGDDRCTRRRCRKGSGVRFGSNANDKEDRT